jgi:ATP-dependent Clp protease adaptor protein ClpS
MGKTLTDKTPRKTEVPDDTGGSSHGWRVVLFNDDWHTFQEVAFQLMKATGCTQDRGFALANVVHHTGSAIVYQGAKSRCEDVARVLEAIRLKTQVAQ